ncbi:23S rRNA (pseudouridine(1915)-N(3))-methyltransferase RlmH [candidate division GN15 bacterium]|uniref:Ribosomal RNA large subunit methyltransferase H n=1 Tax=candidate division GN15 bacterium TaxID=2072418 RepID=A0A855X366_9BACT|nr:MAG: 23S rRNA (pseudouridine(1915)-N(3))-methyltransferase RlmH [candidate division GN15 bacterium]
MLKIRIIAIGEPKDQWIADGCEHYTKLISRWARVETKILPSPKGASSLPPAQIMEREAERIARELGKGKTIALSDRGKRFDSAGFAKAIRSLELTSGGTVTFLIGGPYGLAPRLIDAADDVYSLSPLTFSHQLARIVLLEQLYRAYTIIHGTAYHK